MLCQGASWSGIHVVCGFSSAGKSQYMRRLLTTPGLYLGATPVYEGMFRSGARTALQPGDVFHLDISSEPNSRWRSSGKVPCVRNHPLAAKGILSNGITSVDILVLPETELRERISKRMEYGDDIGRAPVEGAYPRALKLRVLDRCPLEDRYSVWIDFFEEFEVSVRFIHSGDRRYEVLPNRVAALKVVRGCPQGPYGTRWLRGRFGRRTREPSIDSV